MSSLENLVRQARKRWMWGVVLEQSSLALAAALLGVIVLLLVGTQILNWYWLVAIFIATLAFGIIRIGRRIPAAYSIAQTLDHRLASHDTLSTAFYFKKTVRPGDQDVMLLQRAEAEKLAATVDPRIAFPYHTPRALQLAGVLVVAAFTLLGLRYGIRRSLDLRPPIAQAMIDFFQPGTPSEQARKKQEEAKKKQDFLQENGISTGEQTELARAELGRESEVSVESPEGQQGKQGSESQKKSEMATGQQSNDPESSDEKGERSSGATEPSNGGDQPGTQAGTPPKGRPPQPPSQGKQGNQNKEESSLMQKMREAMANLLDKMKMQPPQAAEGQQSANLSKKGSESGGSKKTSDPNGKPEAGKPNGEGGKDAKGQGDQEGEGNEKAQGGKSKGERGGNESATKDAQSGIGKEDGDKSLREAENLAAMGKLSEIIGKRSQNVTGEMMVEVSSGKQQQLKTQYSNKRAVHAESGGEIHRDEVPLVYQQYVQQYFEEIRKTPAVKAKTAGAQQ